MTDQSGTVSFGYDARGRLTDKISTIMGHAYPISRAYTPGGRVSFIAYPTGRTVDYQRGGCACNVSSITTSLAGNVITLMSDLTYQPFGGVSGMDNGAGGIIGSQSDLSGRLTVSNPGAVHEKTYGYDNNDNLTSISAPSMPWQSRTYGYDALNRLTHAEGPYGIIDYSYDGVGNRLAKTENSITTAYTYYPGTNRLHEVVTGEETGIDSKLFTYNLDNRLIRVEENSVTLGEYTYNGLGQRIIKNAGGVTTIFHYDFDGNIIAESDQGGSISKEYLYKGSSRLAMVDVLTGNMYYYGNDKLGTPQIMTDSTNTVVWEGEYKPFGEADVNPNSSIVNNFRFPGQYFDAETGLHYNYHRYYDPKTGRYVTPDPIGLAGGINPFIYSKNNPINFIDPFGLDTWSGAGDEVGGFLGIAGASTMYGFITNWDTGEKCYVETKCYKLGVGLAGSVTAQNIWIPNGPKLGNDLAGSSIGMGVEGGLGGYISGSPAGTASTSSDGTTSISGGAGLGAGFAEYAQKCTTRVISCENTPKQCGNN